MRSVLLLLMVSVTQVQLSSFCPDSCVVCSNDVIICSKLSMIPETPDSTKALVLTDGLIDIVDRIVSSYISNMSVLVLSNNIITTIRGNAFQNLTLLRTLSLDHNLISSPSLDRSTFSWLHKLETLHLSHNSLKEINGSWFQKTNSLKTLLMEGNLLTTLNSNTFASSDLRSLETLDLSDNLISYVGRDSFRNLPRLSSLDLSRNRLQVMPDAFSHLLWLSKLNLDLNQWNCSCELNELVHFLNTYVQFSDKVLSNGKRMACTSSDNPIVQTVLELTDTNCMPANRSVTAKVTAKSSITSRRYIRDIVIAVVCSWLGGVMITLALLAAIHRRLGKRFKLMQRTKGLEEQSSQTWDLYEGKEELSMSYAFHNSNYRGHPPGDKVDASSDSRPDTPRNHFICQNCRLSSSKKTFHQKTSCGENQPNIREEWSTYWGSDQWKDSDVCLSRNKDEAPRDHVEGIRGLNTDYRRHIPREDIPAPRMQEVALRRHISIAQRQTFTPEKRVNSKRATRVDYSFLKHHHGGYGSLPVCHYYQTYTDDMQDRISRNQQEAILPRSSKLIVYRDTLNYNQSKVDHQARVQRSVTFDLSMERALFVPRKEGPYKISKTKMSKGVGQKRKQSLSKISSKENKNTPQSSRSKSPKARFQGNGKLKVKFNLNPVKSRQIHPKSGSNHENRDVKKTYKKIKKDKCQNAMVERNHGGQESQEESKKEHVPGTFQCDESSTNLEVVTQPEESGSMMQSSNVLAESTEPLGRTNTTDHHFPTLDSNLPVSTTEDSRRLQKEDGENLPDIQEILTPVSSTVSVVQEYLSSGDGSPKRKIRLIIPEKTSSRPQTALDKKIR